MPNQRTAKDWTPEAIRRFWEWQASRPELQKQYFSRQVGRALARVLEFAGGLHGNVLDFGCGPGYLLERMCQRPGVTGHGVDFSPRSAQETSQRLQGRPNFAGAQPISELPAPFADGHFDALTCIETVEHLLDDHLRPLLAEHMRLLKPGGIAMYTTPNNEDLDRAQAHCPFCDSQYHNMQHLRAFTPESLRAEVSGAGFEVVFCQGLDLWRFQKPKGRKLVDYTLRDLVTVPLRGAGRLAARALDGIAARPFPQGRLFGTLLAPGPHLLAIVRKPA